jgi:predicted RNA-binding protein
MIENKNPQEKLLAMLTEIYDQLEELEEVLEHSLSDLRGNLYQKQSTQLNFCEEKITDIEEAYRNEMNVTKNVIENQPNHKKTLKLELGF